MAGKLDLMGWAEAAETLGVEKSRIGRWRRRGVVLPDGRRVRFPEPVVTLRATPVWCGSDVRALRDWLSNPPEPSPEPWT